MPYNLPTSVIHLEDFNNDAKCFLDSLTPKLDKTDYKYAHCYVMTQVELFVSATRTTRFVSIIYVTLRMYPMIDPVRIIDY